MRLWWIGWSLFSWLSVIFCSVGTLLPHWIHGSLFDRPYGEVSSNIGLFRRCTYPIYTAEGAVLLLRQCGQYEFLLIPNLYWQVALIILLIACSVGLTVTLVIFFLGCCLDLLQIQCVQRGIQVVQLFAGLLALTACLIYPFGWTDNTEVEQICGQASGRFQLGRCQIGWAFVMSSMGGIFTVLTSMIPILMNYRLPSFNLRTHGAFFPVPTQDSVPTSSRHSPYATNKGRRYSQPNLNDQERYPPVVHRSRATGQTPRRASLCPDGTPNRYPHRHSTPMIASTSPTSFLLGSLANHSSVESQLTHLWILSPPPTAQGGSIIFSNQPPLQKQQQPQQIQALQQNRESSLLEDSTRNTGPGQLDQMSRDTSQESIVPSFLSMHNFNKHRGVQSSTHSCESPLGHSVTPSSDIQRNS